MHPLAPPPAPATWPARLPSPFAVDPPHPLALRAAEDLQRRLQANPPVTDDEQERGKMFGVLVVADAAGRVGYLSAFSGMLGGRWLVDGFVGPTFDLAARDALWPGVEAQLNEFDRRLSQLNESEQAARAALAAIDARLATEAVALAAQHAARRATRRAERARITASLPPSEAAPALHALDQESRADAAAERAHRARARDERAAPARAVEAIATEAATLKRTRVAASCEALERLFDGYRIINGRGETRSLRAIFAPETPPGGAGDCAAPKLFTHALRAGLRPLALAEFWWGASPLAGGRHHGLFYPACRAKCGPLLTFLLDGLDASPAPLFVSDAIDSDEPRVVFEDRWLLVVDKPIGLLSVPGRHALAADSVLTRLRRRHPEASGPMLVHRLDLDTSGLLLVAKDPDTYTALQAQFIARAIEKRYVALLDGPVAGDAGRIELALRVDFDDRPRQIHDAHDGKFAATDWRVLSREAAHTRVALFPRTGRTHQLRVHAAHALGLGAPIIGDRLYGRPGPRLMLHAERLSCRHPHTGELLLAESPAPF